MFATRECAAGAIEGLHGKSAWENGDCTLVVEWMDEAKQRVVRVEDGRSSGFTASIISKGNMSAEQQPTVSPLYLTPCRCDHAAEEGAHNNCSTSSGQLEFGLCVHCVAPNW